MTEDAARGADRRPAGDRAPHVREGAPRRRRRARAGAVEEGPVHGRQGRRRVRGLRHRRHRVRPVHRADRALRRRAGPRLDDGRRLLPVRRAAHIAARREHAARSTGSATRCGCRWCASTWSGGRSTSGSSTILDARARGRAQPRAARRSKAQARRRERGGVRTRPGKRERASAQGRAASRRQR